MTRGLRQAAGNTVTGWLARFARTPVSGAVTGTAATAIVQSSSATTVAAVGFVSAGLLTFPQALGILFGANLGTTVTGWLVALVGFKLELVRVAPVGVLAGTLLHLIAGGRAAHAARVVAGFSLIFTGVGGLQQGMEGLGPQLRPADFPSNTVSGRVALVALGAVVTSITQSSSAGVATTLTALHAQTIAFPQAAALVIGMDVGTTTTALIASVGTSTQAKRTAAAHVIYNLMTAVLAFVLVVPFVSSIDSGALGTLAADPELSLVAFHSSFNLVGTALGVAFVGPFARVVEALVPARAESTAEVLEPSLLKQPTVALQTATAVLRRCTLRLVELAVDRLDGTASSEARDSADGLRADLDAVRHFADEIPSFERSRPEAESLASLLHLCDHAQRTLRRIQLEFWNGRDEELHAQRRALVDGLRGFSTQAEAADIERHEQRWRQLSAREAAYRDTTLERVAAGQLDAKDALARLSDCRRTVRLAHHLWRLAKHWGNIERSARPAGEPGAGLDQREEESEAGLAATEE